MNRLLPFAALSASSALACAEPRPGCENPDTPGATAGCVVPTEPDEYYAHQGNLYFDTLAVHNGSSVQKPWTSRR